jgi:hypothetical protein
MERDDQQQADGNLPYLQIKMNTIATLKGLRGLAEVEVAHGSSAWKRAIALIDISLDELGQL